MMYNNKLAVCIKTAGKVLREHKDTVYLPFGSEYSIFIKNLNSVRALVKIEIDGHDVTGNGGLVIYGNSEIDLERFIQNGNFNQGNRFKFIERSESVERHRGVGVEDGLLRVEFQFEKPSQINWNDVHDWYKTYKPIVPDPWKPYYYNTPQVFLNHAGDPPPFGMADNGGILRSMSVGGGTATSCTITTTNSVPLNQAYGDVHQTFSANATSDVGITVPGSISDQKFVTAAWFPTEDTKHVMVFKLLGETEKGKAIKAPVTVKAKPKCVTCGRQNKATAKFCTNCGTSLEIV